MLVEGNAGPATEPDESATLPFVIPSEAEGSAVPSTSPPRSMAKTNCHPGSSGQIDAHRKQTRRAARDDKGGEDSASIGCDGGNDSLTDLVHSSRNLPQACQAPRYEDYGTSPIDPKSAESSDFPCPHPNNALYQGTTLVGPYRTSQEWGFSPRLRTSVRGSCLLSPRERSGQN